MGISPLIIVIAKLLLFLSQISSSDETQTISQLDPLHDNGTTLVSPSSTFELGFFSPGNSTNRYVGIWYKQIPIKTVVWVANRDNPIKNNSSKLSISKEGNLVIVGKNGTVYWSTKTEGFGLGFGTSTIAKLLDSGNLVLRDSGNKNGNSEGSYLWQSFDYPTDTLLPKMNLTWNQTSGIHRPLTSWKSWNDPSSGDLSYGVNPGINPGMAIWINGSKMLYRSGPWNGIRLSGVPERKHHLGYHLHFEHKNDEYYYSNSPQDESWISRLVINQTDHLLLIRFTWDEANQTWGSILKIPRDTCDSYNLCGSFGNCVDDDGNDRESSSTASDVCKCLTGFEPKSAQNWSEGCVRISESWICKDVKKDGFIRLSNMKVPDTNYNGNGYHWVDYSMTLEQCRVKCWENCSCSAYANWNIRERGGGTGCMMWFGDLRDLRYLLNAGQDLYVRSVDASKTDGKNGSKKIVVVVTSSIFLIIVLLLVLTLIYWRTKSKFREIIKTKLKKKDSKGKDIELPLFDLDTIARATDNFSNDNKLGEGGFGPVYRGTLPNGKDVAIKRLSQKSTQGAKEFENEVIFCSKLQHRNLVKVLGYCTQEDEKLLVYEYLAKKSLDLYLFDSSQNTLLSWSDRFNIILGIARGLVYLHQDSRLRIIHRDLKPSNILLDNSMNPKISDFGLARMCDSDRQEGSTSRVVGTYGYMAPEYAIDGIFSTKSDIFSFGIMLSEIISGKRNKEVSNSEDNYNILGHAWKLWKESIPMEFIDPRLGDSYVPSEALRCLHVSLLCAQHNPNDRPNMRSVIVMLTSESVLPQPKEPLLLIEKVSLEDKEPSSQKTCYSTVSTNDLTISVLEPR